MLKSADGSYRHETLPFGDALRERERIFATLVEDERPDVVVVDRHPYGTAGELRTGLDLARGLGSALVLGLRDVLDEPSIVREEMRGRGWADVEDVYDDVLVYGGRHFVDHEAEYGLSLPLHYCGWVVERTGPEPSGPQPPRRRGRWRRRRSRRLRDGRASCSRTAPTWSVSSLPVRTPAPTRCAGSAELGPGRARVVESPGRVRARGSRAPTRSCAWPGYNSTLEALAAGRRPILMPRRNPRREQAIRADWLAGPGARRRRRRRRGSRRRRVPAAAHPAHLPDGALEAAGIDLDGALNAARRLHALSTARSVR